MPESRMQARALLLSTIVALAGCSSLVERRTPYEPSQDQFSDIAAASKRVADTRGAALEAADKIGEYLDAGVTLSDLACEAWFTGLAKAERNSTLTKDLMNVAGNLLLGVAGINGANPDNLARGALGLAAANTSFEIYRSELLLGSIEEIRAKIREGRKVAADAILQTGNISFDSAKRRLMEYHQQCSVERITVLLNTSLSGVKFQRPDVTLTQAVDQATAAGLVSTLQLGNVDELIQDPDLLYQTYLAIVAYPASSESDPDVVKSARNHAVVKIYLTRHDKLVQANKDAVVVTLQRIGVLLKFGDRLKTDLAAGAAKKEAEAREALTLAQARLEAKVESLRSNTAFNRAFGLDSRSLSARALALEVLRVHPGQADARLNLQGESMDAELKGALQTETQQLRDAQARLALASASAARAKGAAPAFGDVTPRIVPNSR